MILFFESYSIIQTIVLFKKVRKANTIYFHSGVMTPFSYRFKGYTTGDKYKNVVIKMIRAINRNVKIHAVSQKLTNEHNWLSNKESLSIIDNLRTSIENSASYKIILSIIGDKNIIKYYQHYMAQGYISSKIVFIKIAKDLISSNNSAFIIPIENDFFEIVSKFVGLSLDRFVPPVISKTNWLLGFGRKLKNSMILLFFPILYLIREVFQKGFNLKKLKKRYDVLQKVAYGFSKDGINSSQGGRLTKIDDGYLYNEPKGLRSIIYVFDRKNYGNGAREESKGIMTEKGIPYMDVKDYKVNINMIRACLKIQFQILLYIFKLPSLIREYSILIYISYHAIYDLLQKLLELEYIETKVEFCIDDANADHIIRTIVSNRSGIKTVGVQHRVIPHIFPQICYVHYDKYCIFGSAYLRLCSPYWQRLNLAKTGNMLVDKTIRITHDRDQLNNIKTKVISLYSKRKHTILIVFPNPLPRSLSEKWDEMYNALSEFKTLYLDANVFLRFRNVKDLNHPLVKRFTDLPKRDNRIIIDHTDFTTYEIMTICDLFITNSASTSMIEAVAAGKKSFTFDYMGTAGYCYGKYGRNIILKTKEDVLRVFKELETDFAKFDCDWSLLRKEFNYYYDGKCLERIQRAVMESIREEESHVISGQL